MPVLCRFTWQSGRAFNGEYDAAPANISNFVRVDQGNLMQGCDREAYVGCNTWDLMDKSRCNIQGQGHLVTHLQSSAADTGSGRPVSSPLHGRVCIMQVLMPIACLIRPTLAQGTY